MNNLWAFYSSISHVSFSHFIFLYVEKKLLKVFVCSHWNEHEWAFTGSVFCLNGRDVCIPIIEWLNEAFIPAINSLTFTLRILFAIKKSWFSHTQKMHFRDEINLCKHVNLRVISKAKKIAGCFHSHFIHFIKLNWDEYFMLSEYVEILLFLLGFSAFMDGWVTFPARLRSFYL